MIGLVLSLSVQFSSCQVFVYISFYTCIYAGKTVKGLLSLDFFYSASTSNTNMIIIYNNSIRWLLVTLNFILNIEI